MFYSCVTNASIVFQRLCGFPPFYDDNNAKLFAQIKSGRFSYPKEYWKNVSEEAKDLINKLLVVEPEARLDAKGKHSLGYIV